MGDAFFPQGIKFLNAAVAQDRAQNYKEALRLYVRSLEYFIAGLKYSKNEKVNALVRVKAKEYMERAERIRSALAMADSQQQKQTAQQGAQVQANRAPAGEAAVGGRLATRQADESLRSALGDTLLHEKPNLTWDDVAGLDKARKTLEEAVLMPQKFPQLFVGNRKAWKGILLYGPPGTGKSYLAKVIASVSNASFFSVSSADLVSKYFGQSEKLVRELFILAIEKKPSIIFIDEIDAICAKRSDGQQESSQRMLTEFLTCMTDISDVEGVLVMGATNRPFDLDPAVRRRFEKRIYIPLPNEQAEDSHSTTIVHSKQDGVHLDEHDFKNLAVRTEGFSGSDIQNVCRDALMQPVRECLRAKHWRLVEMEENGRVSRRYAPCFDDDIEGAVRLDMMQLTPETLAVPDVHLTDFEKTLVSVKPSVSQADLQMHEEFTRQFGIEGTTADDEEEPELVTTEDVGKGKERLVEMEMEPPFGSSAEPRSKRRRSSGGKVHRRTVAAV